MKVKRAQIFKNWIFNTHKWYKKDSTLEVEHQGTYIIMVSDLPGDSLGI